MWLGWRESKNWIEVLTEFGLHWVWVVDFEKAF